MKGRAYAQDSLYMQLANTRFGHARDFTYLFHCQFLKDYLAEPGAILFLDETGFLKKGEKKEAFW